jgi:serine/threonine-protein kinase
VAAAEGVAASPEAVCALLVRLFPNPEDLGEPVGPRASPASSTGLAHASDAPPETPPHGVGAVDEGNVPLEVLELPTRPVPLRPAARDVSSTHTRERRRARAGRAALLVAGASAVLAVALGSSTCLHRFGSHARQASPPLEAQQPGPSPAPQGIGGGPLTPIESAPAKPEGVPAPVVVSTPVVVTAPAEDAPKEATLRIQTDGAASFVVDGRAMRTAPDGALHLRPGKHTVTVNATGLASARSLTVELAPGEAALRAVHGGRGWLRVAITPWAEVVVDGKTLGVTPLQPVELAEGPHLVTLKNSDLGVTTKRRLLVTPNKETLLKVDLFSR